ncbi:MerR family transcriptional regulator [Paenibacillus sp. OV219]|uniref:MerR family transcriptional regulator n=1 Tax=Paenibacillus sp. OV219 TaxID=1884377 RepID=UPI0008B97F35|nr:MerR family transcriptional regulator [Paenibacillus sp. OV219]SEO96575.1 transcriptional regulator, MerR family [Paenibacillus sp. OV219]
MMNESHKYTMEEVTERLGITARTLHYYEEIGLLPAVTRSEGRHRLFDEAMLQRIEHILKLKQVLGASLVEIREIMQAEEELDRIRATYYSNGASDDEKDRLLDEAALRLQEIITHIDEKLEKLQTLRQGFSDRLERATRLKQRSE